MSGAGAGDDVRLTAVSGAPAAFAVVVHGAAPHAAARAVTVTGVAPATGQATTATHQLRETTHAAYLDLFAALAATFGTRPPGSRQAPVTSVAGASYRVLLTENVSPDVRDGYGDPAVLRVHETAAGGGEAWYYLLVTSNDAPDAFPILRSRDLADWRLVGFVFPRGRQPRWAADGAHVADFWAPELHRVGGEYRVYFAARERADRSLAIGVATSAHPGGPFATPDEPLLRGGVIDPHVAVDGDGTAYLFWKDDANGVWPARLGALLHAHGPLVAELFAGDEDRRTASLVAALWPWARALEPMERFFVEQPLIEAVSADFAAFRARLLARREREADADVRRAVGDVLAAMRTPVWAQRLAPDGRSLVGERTLVLENDLAWEAHLVEGVWVTPYDGRHYLFYAGNDFSTAQYGIGVAVADRLLGPYRKQDAPFLRSTAAWWGPGHPSVAEGPDGRPWLFLHAFPPGRAGYGAFRALLALPIAFDGDRVVPR